MKIRYIFSSPEGDIPAEKAELDMPFRVSPWENHPFLSVRDYFDAIRHIVGRNNCEILLYIVNEEMGIDLKSDEIQEILIRSEKHGALYHLASVQILSKQGEFKFSLSVALSENSRAQLSREFGILRSLHDSFKFSYLPRVFVFEEMAYQAEKGTEKFSILLAEWFEDCHEWHISEGEDHLERVRIWDLKRGHRFATELESFQIFKQASKILALYYDAHSFKQIYPWHHAAGDFVIGTKGKQVSVRLTTARDYSPIKVFLFEENVNPITALVYFFLHLSIRMRLDKLDGVGNPVLAGPFSIKAVTEGYFEALRRKEETDKSLLGDLDGHLSLLRSFTPREILRLYGPLLDMYSYEDPEDFHTIEFGLENHISLVHKALKEFRL